MREVCGKAVSYVHFFLIFILTTSLSHLKIPFVLQNGAKLNSLLYEDYLIILSRSKTGPQNCLDKLSSFCTSWIMKINPKINLVDSQIIDVEQE